MFFYKLFLSLYSKVFPLRGKLHVVQVLIVAIINL